MAIDDLQPDEVIAMHFSEPALGEDLAAWCGGELVFSSDGLSGEAHPSIMVPTVDGSQRAELGDWIVQGSEGDFSAISAEDFAARHTPMA